MQKPSIITINSEKELRQWYWKKVELIVYAKLLTLPYNGSKFEILDRICDKLEHRETIRHTPISTSKFDWSKENIVDSTVITDTYKNSQKVRLYMKSKIPDFKFNIAFMDWVKANNGKTMNDAVNYYIHDQKLKISGMKTDIKAHNQFNQYLRDFFINNPSRTSLEAKKCWTYKTSLPSADGRHIYTDDDLSCL